MVVRSLRLEEMAEDIRGVSIGAVFEACNTLLSAVLLVAFEALEEITEEQFVDPSAEDGLHVTDLEVFSRRRRLGIGSTDSIQTLSAVRDDV